MRVMIKFNLRKVITDKSIFVFFLIAIFICNSNSLFSKINLSNSSSESRFPAIAVNSAGEIMVVWTEWSSGQIFYAVNTNGNWTSMRNTGLNVSKAWSNEIAVDSYGTFHITCADGVGSHSRDIAYSYFQGNSWAPSKMIYISPYNSAWNKMDIDKNDDIHVIWYHSIIPKTEGVYKSNAVTMSKSRMGSWPSSFVDISHSPNVESIHPAIAVLNKNVYTSWMEGGPPRRIYFCEKIGGSWKAPIQIESGYYPDMVVDNSGNVHVVFSNWGGNLWYISRMNGRWQPVEAISNGVAPLQFGEIQHKNNVIVAAWVQGADGNWSIHASAKLVGGNWQIPIKIADAPGGAEGNKYVHLALDNKNCAHFVWEGIGVGGKNDIFYEKYYLDTPKDATFIEVDNSFLSFHTDVSSSIPSDQTFRVRASGAGSINYTISEDEDWLSVSPTQGFSSGEWNTVTVSVNSHDLNDGTYNGKITITDPDAYNNPVDVGVTLTIGEGGGGGGGGDDQNPSFLETDKVNMEFKMEEGVNPPSQTFNLRATGGKSLKYSISTPTPWLSVSPNKGTVTSTWVPISVSVEADNKKPGKSKGRIDITAAGASNKVKVTVYLTIEKKRIPSIQLNKTRLYFWGYAHGDNPASSTFKIRNSGSQTLQYKITSNKGFIHISPSQGASTGEWDTVNVVANSLSLGVGKHKANIQITASKADNTPQIISIEFEVEMPPQPYPPVDITVKKLNHEGLVFQEYKSQVEWKANSRNNGLFDIVKYRIHRRDKHISNSAWIYIGEVAGNVFIYYDGGFTSKDERNRYVYSVLNVDSTGKESVRAEQFAVGEAPVMIFSEIKSQNKDRKSEKKESP
jgi:hypothetical protein